jgi:Xaa-Pro aminopeptidase
MSFEKTAWEPDFPSNEYETRSKRAKDLMEEEKLDALFITGDENYTYFSGHKTYFQWASFSRPVFLILPKIQDPSLIVHDLLGYTAQGTTWIKDVKTYSKLSKAPIEIISNLFKDMNISKGRIGMELGYEQRIGFSYNDLVNLKHTLPEAEFVDASQLLWDMRMIKSEREVDHIRRSNEILDRSYKESFPMIKAGMKEDDLARILYIQMMVQGAEKPGFTVINSRSKEIHIGHPSNQILKEKETIWVDAGCIFKGYWSDFSRNAVIGSASDMQIKSHDLLVEITRRCADLIAPDVKISKIVEFCNNQLQKEGLIGSGVVGRIGHGLGMSATEPPDVSLENNEMLKPGMVITLEPAIVNDSGFYCLEEVVQVTKNGFDILTKKPELFVV